MVSVGSPCSGLWFLTGESHTHAHTHTHARAPCRRAEPPCLRGCAMTVLSPGPIAPAPDSQPFGPEHFGYSYTGFRDLDRFLAQLADRPLGLITWPGGTIVETMPDRLAWRMTACSTPRSTAPIWPR